MFLHIIFNQGSSSWKTWKITKRCSMHGNIMEFEKKTPWIIIEKSWNFMKIFYKTTSTVARKLAVRHTVRQLEHRQGVHVPLRALFLVLHLQLYIMSSRCRWVYTFAKTHLSHHCSPGLLVQWVKRLTADPGVGSLTTAPYFRGDWSWNNFYSHSPPTTVSRRVVVSYKRKYVQEVLVNQLLKLAQEKVWLSELTISTWP